MYGVAVDSYCEQNSHNKFFFDYCGCFIRNKKNGSVLTSLMIKTAA